MAPDPTPIVRLSTAFWESRVLLTANRLRVRLPGHPSSTRWPPACRNRPAQHRAAAARARTGLGFLLENGQRLKTHRSPSSWCRAARPSWATSSATATSCMAPGATSKAPCAATSPRCRRRPPGRRPGAHARLRRRAMHVAGAGHRPRPWCRCWICRVAAHCWMSAAGWHLLGAAHPSFPACAPRSSTARVAAVARELVTRRAPARKRVVLRDGDYHGADFGSGKDVVLMSGMFHRETAQASPGADRARRRLPEPGRPAGGERRVHRRGGCQPALRRCSA